MKTVTKDINAAIAAQANLHHQYFLGLQLMVAVEENREVTFDWMFRLFRQQHLDKFLSSFEKLGLSEQPDAIACAKYHVLSNSMGGVDVEYMPESETKAWVRFRYPRWMFAGPTICGIPVEASRGFLHGWYAHNGVSLGNARLGFVCVSEDMTGQFGLCGYFKEYEHDLDESQRLVFAPDERVPDFDPSDQPEPPSGEWDEERLVKANRNYALEYVRNGVKALTDIVGRERGLELAKKAARLTGLQYYQTMARAVGATDGNPQDAAEFLVAMLRGMGDESSFEAQASETQASETQAGVRYDIRQTGLRIVRGLSGSDRDDLLLCWIELWKGAIASHRSFMDIRSEISSNSLLWSIQNRVD